ncbi:MAG: polysaccharide deacetylase family protein, partial [Oscillospiraceae bacterium]|nr:polysaccharide deacetylase family protein [Oscillospiraceae bacterium]
IYLWTGVHDLFSELTPEEFGDTVVETAEKLREQNPDSMVIILSMTPAAEEKGAGDTIAKYNSALHSAVRGCPDRYMIYMDIFTELADENGFLRDVYDMGDGVSLSRTGCRRVLNLIEENRFYSDLCGDEKYRYIYKDIYAQREEYTVTEGKVAYLTFDDGPSKYTPEVLDILAENDIKATFFITGWCIDGKEETLQRVAAEGHTVALHSWSHDYEEIYESTEAFLDDFARVYNRVYDVTGKKPWAFRFPGGSYNNFNRDTADEIIAEMKRRGFAYYDWNAATSDATTSATYDSCIEYLTDSLIYDHSVVLMHDSLELTPQYLQEVIDIVKEAGYSFETIDTANEVQF